MEKTNRQQTEKITFRVLPEIKKMLEEDAAKSGLSLSGLVKFRTCGEAAAIMPTRQKRRSADVEVLRQILGQLGKIGSNHNQIARVMNGLDVDKLYQINMVVIYKENLRHMKSVNHRLGEIRIVLLRALGVIRK